MRMSLVFLFAFQFLVSNNSFSQNDGNELKFETIFYRATGTWVVLPKQDTDLTYAYGFLYLDSQKGFTFHFENRLGLINDKINKIEINPDFGSKKQQITKDSTYVAILDKKQISALNLPKEPDWFVTYKKGSDEVEYLKNEGFYYNSVGASDIALKSLVKAYKKNEQFEGLEYELGYAYNALGQFEKAAEVLEKATIHYPKEIGHYRELAYAYQNLNQPEKAENIYLKGVTMSDDDVAKSQAALIMTKSYFDSKNKAKFDMWASLTKNFVEKDSEIAKYINYLESQWGNR